MLFSVEFCSINKLQKGSFTVMHFNIRKPDDIGLNNLLSQVISQHMTLTSFYYTNYDYSIIITCNNTEQIYNGKMVDASDLVDIITSTIDENYYGQSPSKQYAEPV